MSLAVDLVLLASNQLWNPLVTEGSNTKLNPLSHTHRNSLEYWETEKNKIQNEPNIGAGASSIHPTLEPSHYRGLQH
jgi:glucokinase